MTPNADGPDLSHWNVLTAAPPDPAWRLWSHKCSEGAFGGDGAIAVDKFAQRWQAAREYGYRWRGAYHWLRSDAPVADQVANLTRRVDRLGGLQRGEFIQLDWEVTTGIPNATAKQVIEWCDLVEAHYGRECVAVYSSDWVPDFFTWRSRKPDVVLWYANYNLTDKSQGGWAECAKFHADVWQWTSSFIHAHVAGRFDMNHVFNAAALDRITDQLPEEDEMQVFIRPKSTAFEFSPGNRGLFTVDGQPVSGEYLAALDAAKVQYSVVDQDHKWWDEATLHKLGESARRLYGDKPET